MTRRLALHCCSTGASPGRRGALLWDQRGLTQPSRTGQRHDASIKEQAEEARNRLPSVDLCLSQRAARPQRLAPGDARSSGQLHFCPARARLLPARVHSGIALLEVNSKAAMWSPVHCLSLVTAASLCSQHQLLGNHEGNWANQPLQGPHPPSALVFPLQSCL